ncbi:MAG TPA: electron-transfer flavoprotein:ubiquinone oxidoreductase [Thermomicrobiales bacterium]|nr:electron-transfer flavoprotein:ubiquinone oxidoreductase [Thermomicrobiales bacterium]
MMRISPAKHQAPLLLNRIILEEETDPEAVPMDVLFVGAGPAGLAGAIELARLVAADDTIESLEIGVIDKAGSLGEHNLSGAVVNPRVFQELFPDLAMADFPFRQEVDGEAVYLMTGNRQIRIPTPPTMRNHGNYAASICEIVRWLGDKAEAAGVNIFTGFPVDALLVEGKRVTGVRTTPTGLERDGGQGSDFSPPTDLTAQVTVLSEGTRGMLTQGWKQWRGVSGKNPQIYALGVKEVWQVAQPLDRVIHTLGWPLPTNAFGGSFIYPQGPNQVAIGLVVGLDYRDAALDVHELLQRLKLHPLVAPILTGGTLLEWGAKTIPEGGWLSVPSTRVGDGLMITGDAAGFVDVPSLKGIHYAMQSGIYAARAAFAAIKAGDTSAAKLAAYDQMVNESYIATDLQKSRNIRLAFADGFVLGGAKAGLMTLTNGRFPGGNRTMHADADQERTVAPAEPFMPDNVLTFSKLDAVFKSGNATRDTVPNHLIVGQDIAPEVADFYSHVCPAGVYERVGDELRINPPNCIDCKATDVLGPRWTPREGGSGPAYREM